MKGQHAFTIALALIAGTMVSACANDNQVAPQNRRPVILSLTAFPDAIGPGDSAIVICNASEPDADTLWYDWITDSRIRLKGTVGSEHTLFNTSSNSLVVYQGHTFTALDTGWVQCFARDGRGKSDSRVVYLRLLP